jgi:hypothetical protein
MGTGVTPPLESPEDSVASIQSPVVSISTSRTEYLMTLIPYYYNQTTLGIFFSSAGICLQLLLSTDNWRMATDGFQAG